MASRNAEGGEFEVSGTVEHTAFVKCTHCKLVYATFIGELEMSSGVVYCPRCGHMTTFKYLSNPEHEKRFKAISVWEAKREAIEAEHADELEWRRMYRRVKKRGGESFGKTENAYRC